MGKVFLNQKYSDYLGENRALLDIIVRNVPETPQPSPTPTPNPMCPEEFVITESTDPVNYNGTYQRKYSYSGGSMTYGYLKDGIGYVGTAPDGFNYPVFKEMSSNKFISRKFSISNVDNGWTTSSLTGDPWSSPAIGGTNSSNFMNYITISGARWVPAGYNVNSFNTRSFYLTYPASCPTTTPTATVTATVTPTVTTTVTTTPTNTLTPSTSPL